MITLHVYRADDPDDSVSPVDSQELIAHTPCWLARRQLDVDIIIKGHDFTNSGTDYVFAKEVITTDWLWTGAGTYTYSTRTQTSQYEDGSSNIRGYQIVVSADGIAGSIKDDDVTEVTSDTGGVWSPSAPSVGTVVSESTSTSVVSGGFEITTVTTYTEAVRTVVITYTEQVTQSDIATAMTTELTADWDDTGATGWSAAPPLVYSVTEASFIASKWLLPDTLTTSSLPLARVTRMVGTGIRNDPTVWIKRETVTANGTPTSTDEPVVLVPETKITTDDILNLPAAVISNMAPFDTQSPPQLLRSIDTKLIFDAYTTYSLGVGDDYTISVEFLYTWRGKNRYSIPSFIQLYSYVKPTP